MKTFSIHDGAGVEIKMFAMEILEGGEERQMW